LGPVAPAQGSAAVRSAGFGIRRAGQFRPPHFLSPSLPALHPAVVLEPASLWLKSSLEPDGSRSHSPPLMRVLTALDPFDASSFDLTWMIPVAPRQLLGFPQRTVGSRCACRRRNLTRAPLELDCSPVAVEHPPSFTISSFEFRHGREYTLPRHMARGPPEFLGRLDITMKRIVVSSIFLWVFVF